MPTKLAPSFKHSRGDLAAAQAAQIVTTLGSVAKIIETSELIWRIEALEVVNKPKRRGGLVTGLEGKTADQTFTRLGLHDDDTQWWIVVLQMKRERTDL